MFNPTWSVIEHIIPASHPRGYLRGVRDPQSSTLRLHVKQYIPARTSALPDTAITLIAQHGMPPGDNKEALEPFLWDLVCHASTPPIRQIFALDVASSAQSFILNEDEIGDAPHWFDSARDIMAMVNYFQAEMKPPLVGFAYSWGANSIIMCSSWHPRMFQAVVLAEPVVENGWFHAQAAAKRPSSSPTGREQPSGGELGAAFAKRRSRWASREEVRKWLFDGKNLQYRQYDARVLEQLMKYDLHELEDGSVEFKTPAAQIVPMFLLPSPPLPGFPENEEYAMRTIDADHRPGFYAGLGPRVKQAMTGIHSKVLFLWAKQGNFISDAPYRERLLASTGTGLGGGGGRAKGQVEEVFIDGAHALPHIVPTAVADAIAVWLRDVIWPQWQADEAERQRAPPVTPLHLPAAFLDRLKGRGQVKL